MIDISMPPERKTFWRRANIFRLSLLLVIFYLSLLGSIYVFQRSLTFQPSGSDPFLQTHPPFETLFYQTPMGLTLRGLYVPAAQGKPTIVYFHGNGGNIADRLYKAENFLPYGYGMAFVGYRGYSGNPGQATEQNFYEDGRAVIHMLQDRGVSVQDMILYGESIGSGTATQMATEFSAKALVLEAPFTSAVDIGAARYWFLPVKYMMKDRFDNAAKIGNVRMPVLIVHGTADRTVPYKYGKELFSHVRARGSHFVTIDNAGHGDLYKFGAGGAINAFLARL